MKRLPEKADGVRWVEITEIIQPGEVSIEYQSILDEARRIFSEPNPIMADIPWKEAPRWAESGLDSPEGSEAP